MSDTATAPNPFAQFGPLKAWAAAFDGQSKAFETWGPQALAARHAAIQFNTGSPVSISRRVSARIADEASSFDLAHAVLERHAYGNQPPVDVVVTDRGAHMAAAVGVNAAHIIRARQPVAEASDNDLIPLSPRM
jgi:hypothetical protein